ncbi:MAG: tRNA (N6-isopentenyl adenosine(37)-C2)-methylthiotransferase MiaB [Nitrospira sp.]|nr:tRNA (N6-isopentenyl adenosine(37)-C2)-methylthiotransferase MiaB [Nitrospira sp.]
MRVKPFPQVHIETFGCQMNESDSELVRSMLKQEGFVFTEDRERADVVLVNTCAIRENAHNKIYAHLSELKTLKKQRPLVVGILGCMAQNLKSALTEKEPLIDVLAGPDAYRQLPSLLTTALETQEQGLSQKGFALDLSEYETYEGIMPDRNGGVNAWITVMRGCDNFCSFCVVPYTRGRERSRDPESILREAHDASARGFRQITLLGQNVNSYRHEEWDFARLITAVADIPGIDRVRFTSPHPKDFPPALIEAIATHPKICKHIHLPLQAGSDRILELMGRTYTGSEYLTLVDRIRSTIPDVVLTTDIICGFCSESDEDFRATARLIELAQLDSAYIFKYSERKNTIAARKYADDIPDQVKGMRVAQLVETQRRITLERNRRYIGKDMDILVEGDATRSSTQAMGKTDGNITVVWDKSTGDIRPGTLTTKHIFDASAATLYGK